MKDVLEMWIRRLREADSETRRAAIRQLEVIGDPAALGALAQVFALDPDLELRKMAQAAGKSIYEAVEYRQTQASAASEAERLRASEILAKAHAKRQRRD